MSDLQSWVAHQFDALMWRQDLSAFTERLLGDAVGPGTAFDRERQTLSAYGQVHWASSGLADLVDSALSLLEHPPTGVWVDLGCAVGRATFEMSRRTGALAVGVDLSFGMLRVAERARREGLAVFPIRRVGVVYDRFEIEVPNAEAENVSFWCCDVDALPFADGVFDGALSLNVLDCVPSPLQHLLELGRVLKPSGWGLLSSPYDWSPTATPIQQWLGGHSQRSAARGSSAAELRRVLTTVQTGLSIEAEREDVPWRVYVNERAAMDYKLHLLRLQRRT